MLRNSDFYWVFFTEGGLIWLSPLVGVYEVKLSVLEIEKGSSKMAEKGRHLIM